MGCGSSTTSSPPPREATRPSPGEDNHDDTSKDRSRGNTPGSADARKHEEEADRRMRELQDQREEQERERRENDIKVQKRIEEERKEREEEKKLQQVNNVPDHSGEDNEEEDKRKQAEDEQRKQEEEKRKREEEEEEKRKQKEDEKQRQEEDRQKQEEEERRKADESEHQKQDELDAVVPDGGLVYREIPCGLKVHKAEFREDDRTDAPVTKPEVGDDLFTDHEFTLGDALGKHGSGLDWKRPQEFAENPVLFSEGTTRFDIGQGSAGTCWFLSLVASISERKDLMQQIFSAESYPAPGSDDYQGMFSCKFWRFGDREAVYTDDKLPVIYDTKLWGAKSATDPNEMWVALLEKAFAKFHGSYLDVYGGQTVDAFLTLTGGVGERVPLESADPQKLFRRLTNAIHSRALVTCTVPAEKNGAHGLVGAHAYSLTGTATVSYKGQQVPLVRIRNPWGKVEWTGPWSDGSAEWNGVSKSAVSRENKDDGEFWMSLEDFFVYFSQASICSISPDFDMDGRKDCLNYTTELAGEWKGKTAAGYENLMANPRFLISVPKSGAQDNGLVPLVVQIVQRMESRKEEKLSIRCDLFQVLGSSSSGDRQSYVYEKMGDGDNTYFTDRQHSFRYAVAPGQYLIVPSTFREGVESDFMIRVFSPCALTARCKVDDNALSMSCDMEDSLNNYKLKNCQCFLAKWRSGANAGGQVSHDSHHSNPQLVFSVCKDEEAVVINIMQESTLPKLPLGLKVYKLSPDAPTPMDKEYLLEHYEDAPLTSDGEQGRFVISWDVNAPYLLPRGRYGVILFTDQPDEAKDIAIVVKSSEKLDIQWDDDLSDLANKGCRLGAWCSSFLATVNHHYVLTVGRTSLIVNVILVTDNNVCQPVRMCVTD